MQALVVVGCVGQGNMIEKNIMLFSFAPVKIHDAAADRLPQRFFNFTFQTFVAMPVRFAPVPIAGLGAGVLGAWQCGAW